MNYELSALGGVFLKGLFDNTLLLARLILRRERVSAVVWILVTGLFLALIVSLFGQAMDDESRMEMAAVIMNPAMIAMVGPAYGLDNFTIGAMMSVMMLVFTAIAVVVMNILFVVRHTRADEEMGRYEVVRSLPTGRLANINATMIAAAIVNIVMSLFVGLCMYFATPDASVTFGGSMLWGALMGVSGIVFAAIAALFSQLSSSSRGAKGLSFFAMSVFYLMRAIGDVSAEPLSLISPLGMILRAEPYVSDRWWPVFAMLAISVPIAVIAYALNYTRDINQGLLPDRKGKAEGGRLLRTTFGLSVRLLMFGLVIGALTVFSIGASYGTVMGDIEGFVETNEMYQQLLLTVPGYSLPLLFAGMINFIGAMIALVPVLLYILKARGEEKDGRTELVLSTQVCRYKYLGGYAIIAFASSVVFQALTAFGLWVSTTAVIPDPSLFPLGDVMVGNLVYLPAIWVMIGLAVFLIGFAPKRTGLVWAAYGYVFFMSFIGRLPDVLPGFTKYFNPFGVIAQFPMEEVSFPALGVLTVIAVCLTAGGFLFYGRRDIA